ncbi:MAG: L,D-transpeptidase family protein [Gammaproteobacteria bacterium]|nr:L,D-transpeptidase family protein [Gammaproteobacteria bacterium]
MSPNCTSYKILFAWIFFAGLVCLSSASYASLGGANGIEEDLPADAIVNEMHRHLVLDNYENWAPGLDWQKLREFYSKREFLPVWLTVNGPTERARKVRDVLVEADNEGLDPAEYHVPALQYLWRAKRDKSKARLELLLTDALLRYGLEVSAGYRNPRAADIDWHVRPRRINVVRRLEWLLIAPDAELAMRDFPPPHKAYVKLKEKLAYYRELAVNGPWQKVAYAPQLQVGMSHRQIPNIRKRLQQEKYLLPGNNDESELFDDNLDIAVHKFQRYYGHKVDGVVGYFTRKSLNIDVNEQIARIKQNMERWRWMPRSLGRRYVMVNMAGYRLNLVDDGESVMEMPVIIGKTFRATPAFIDSMEYVELNPTWSVPPRIAKEKFLPKMRENPGFLKVNNLKVYESWRKNAKEVDPETIDWQEVKVENFPYKLMQSPGAHNSMGRIKFMFPNRFRVYLHDTPDRTLFDRHIRTFSSGCIRVAEPFNLANKILSWGNKGKQSDVESQISTGETVRINLKRKLPVYLMYWTAWVDEEGEINFRNDIYQRNQKIATSKELDVS